MRYEKLFVSYSVGVFAVCCFVRFAPWAWDNVKLMIWSFLVLGPFMWDMLKRVSFYLRAVLMVGLFWSGGVALWEGLGQHQMHRWLEVREIREAESVLRGIPAKRVRVATKPDVPHPVALCGYPVAMGYAGHLWSHGIEYRELEMALRELYCKGLRSGVLREVTHVFIGPRELKIYGGGRGRVWERIPEGWVEVRRVGDVRLFEWRR
ncbi:MAG: hypothetical protein N2035_03885 [Chthoniobacterales bacterium]|nr:hypothetical protein [Chthoniobacterales bacterium]